MKTTELLYIEDFDQFVELGRAMHEECEPEIPFDELETRSNLFMCVNDLTRADFNAWIVRRDGMIIGFGVARITKYLFSAAPIASMNLWYVKPEFRHTRAAFELLHNFEQWAKLQGAARIEVGVTKCDIAEADKLNRMFKKRNFTRFGELFYQSI